MADETENKHQVRRRFEFTVTLLLLHFTFIILFGVFVRYEPKQLIEEFDNTTDPKSEEAKKAELLANNFNSIDVTYPMFQDVNVMIFIGFGFLMTFLCRYALFDVCVNFLLSAFVIEWAILMHGFFDQLAYHGGFHACGDILPNLHDRCITINIELCLEALFTTAGVLISMGAVLGLCSPLQLVLMAVPEVTLLQLNELIIIDFIGTVDNGKAMTTYAFGAFFGLAAARVLTTKSFDTAKKHSENIGTTYSAELFTMIAFDPRLLRGNAIPSARALRILIWMIITTNDPGDSMTVHTFGAYFGLACARVLTSKAVQGAKTKSKSYESYISELFSMFGTIFLWMYWPSFNAGGATGIERHRAVINTFLSILSSCITAYAVSAAFDHKGRFDMTHLQNCTLAGGVAIGSSGTMVVHPFGALLIGMGAGALSVVGFKLLTPFLNKYRFTDTCGVHNLHGMPGVYSAIVSAIVAGSGSVERYGSYKRLYTVFPRMAPANGSVYDLAYNPASPQQINITALGIEPGTDRSFVLQAGVQIAGILITLGIAIIGGTITGVFITQKFWDQPDKSKLFDDTEFFVPTYAEGQEAEEAKKNKKHDEEEGVRRRKIEIEAST